MKGEPMAVNSSPLSSSLSTSLPSQPSPSSMNTTFWREWLNEGVNISMMLVSYARHIFYYIICELTSPWLPIILGFIFRTAAVWGILNIDLSRYKPK